MLIDLHVHSHHTRGCTLAPREVLRRAKEAGLDGVAFTDLNTLDGVEEIRAAGREVGILALAGVEIATDRGHYLCFFPDPAKVPPPPQVFGSATPWAVRDVLEKVREMGGVAVAAHPYDKSIERPSGDFIFTLDGLSAIEGLNARRTQTANDLAVEAADYMNLPCVAGSDAHASLDEIGKAATLFRDVVKTEADVVAQIRAATVYSVAIGVEPGRLDREAREDRRPPRDRGERGPGERPGDRRGGSGGRGGDRRGGRGRGPRRGDR